MSTNKREYDRNYYANRSPEAKARKQELQVLRGIKNLKLIQEYKSKLGCYKCGETDYICLDFHHISDDKEINIGDGAARWWSINRIAKEIAKCVVICSNCHRKLHRDERLSG